MKVTEIVRGRAEDIEVKAKSRSDVMKVKASEETWGSFYMRRTTGTTKEKRTARASIGLLKRRQISLKFDSLWSKNAERVLATVLVNLLTWLSLRIHIDLRCYYPKFPINRS